MTGNIVQDKNHVLVRLHKWFRNVKAPLVILSNLSPINNFETMTSLHFGVLDQFFSQFLKKNHGNNFAREDMYICITVYKVIKKYAFIQVVNLVS